MKRNKNQNDLIFKFFKYLLPFKLKLLLEFKMKKI